MFLSLCYTKYFALYLHTICHIWDVNDEEVDVKKVFVGSEFFLRLFISRDGRHTRKSPDKFYGHINTMLTHVHIVAFQLNHEFYPTWS